jgi:uncharacterized protein YbcI
MTDAIRGQRPASLAKRISAKLDTLWIQYASERPSAVRTEIHGNVVTCRMIDAVGAFNRSMIAPQAHDTVRGVGKLTLADYKRDAIAAVVRLTGQRVTSFMSSHDRDTDVATEIFTLEPSFGLGRPRSAAGY